MHSASIHIDDTSYEVKLGVSLFIALEDHGVTLPHGCLAGSCSACRVKVTSGSELLSPPSAIEKNTVESWRSANPELVGEATIRLACRAKIQEAGEISIEIAGQ